ncbi:hypothetical protein FTX61_19480 [Nitriliruptoraceae bacterium ZYF776]|nr:hypothetical protein [Profundirhabdus halotolerans]
MNQPSSEDDRRAASPRGPGASRSGGGRDDRGGGARREGRGGARRDDRGGARRDDRGSREDRGRREDRGGRDDGRGSRSRAPAVPGEAKGRPVGADRAQRRSDAPPRRPRKSDPAPQRPDLPDEEPNLPKGVRREIERALGTTRRSRDVQLALSIGAEAIETDHLDVALEVLAWAKHEAPRVATVRESFGIARYLAEDFAGALTELQAYARLTGRVDQHHLIADCHRALGRDIERVEETATALLEEPRAPEDRRAEAAIVLAGAYADAGRVPEARAVLRDLLRARRDEDQEHHLRARSLAADLAVRAGDPDAARRELASIAAVDPEAFDARERLDALDT